MIEFKRVKDCSFDFYQQVEDLSLSFIPKERSEISYDRFLELMRNDRIYHICGFDGGKLVVMATFVYFKTLSRTAVLFEEFVVHKDYRGRGIGKEFDRFIIPYFKSETDATRIEGTLNKENHAVWKVHLSSGFFDRNNKTILAVLTDLFHHPV